MPTNLLTEGLPVDIYWNLHKHVYSVRARTGEHAGRVIAHLNSVTLNNVKLHINKSGQDRVRKEQRKQVHAFLRGDWTWATNGPTWIDGTEITYNPYLHDTFVTKETKTPVLYARSVKGTINGNKPQITT